MIVWYVIFCSSFNQGVCTTPKEMPNAKACMAVGNAMMELAYGSGRFRCISVRR